MFLKKLIFIRVLVATFLQYADKSIVVSRIPIVNHKSIGKFIVVRLTIIINKYPYEPCKQGETRHPIAKIPLCSHTKMNTLIIIFCDYKKSHQPFAWRLPDSSTK